MIRLLLVDDEAAWARTLRWAVRAIPGHPRMCVDDCRTGGPALKRLGERRFHVVILDRGLDDVDGLELGRRVRRAGYEGGLMMLTGRYTRAEDERAAFAAGFDDFVRKETDSGVLVARIAALARRAVTPLVGPRARRAADVEWDGLADAALQVWREEPFALAFSRPVPLTPLEWKILRVLYAERDRIVSRAKVIGEAWGDATTADPTDSLDHHLRALKRKLGGDTARLIESVRGVGLRLNFWNRNLP